MATHTLITAPPLFMSTWSFNGGGGPEFFPKAKGGPEFFPVGKGVDQNFFVYARGGGPEKIGDRPSQADGPHSH